MREVQLRSWREWFPRRFRLDQVSVASALTPVPVITGPVAHSPIAVRTSEPAARSQAALAPARVLLVASDRRFRELAATLLSQRGYAVFAARGGDDDVSELAQRERADVVVLDASVSLTAAARQAARLGSLRPQVGIVAVSAEGPGSLTALPVLAKWSCFDEVLAAVDRACAEARATRRAA